jgi:hypothetical protein
MVGFWKKIQAVTREGEEAGPGQPFPSPNSSRYSWPQEMGPCYSEGDEVSSPGHLPHLVSPSPISKIWQAVLPSSGDDSDSINSPYNACFQGF